MDTCEPKLSKRFKTERIRPSRYTAQTGFRLLQYLQNLGNNFFGKQGLSVFRVFQAETVPA